MYHQSSVDASGAKSFAGDYSWLNYTLSADVNAQEFNSSTYAGIGLFARVQSADTFYNFQYYKHDGVLKIQKCVNGTNTVLASKSCTFSTDTWYKFKATVSSSNLNFYVNDVLELSAGDTDISGGFIGLDAHRTDALFDNVTVTVQ